MPGAGLWRLASPTHISQMFIFWELVRLVRYSIVSCGKRFMSIIRHVRTDWARWKPAVGAAGAVEIGPSSALHTPAVQL
jgi:hypothetical protein